MLKKLFEWYRAVSLQPAAGVLDNRKAAATALVQVFEESENYDLIMATVGGVVAGFEKRFAQDSDSVVAIIQAVKSTDLAFAESLSENALELRVIAAIALGQGMSDSSDNTWGLGAALALLSAASSRTVPKAKFLSEMLAELYQIAQETVERESAKARAKSGAAYRAVKNLKADELADHAALVTKLLPALQQLFEEQRQQASIDREEANILWWLFGEVSATAVKVPFKDLPDGSAALCLGADVGNMVVIPAVSSAEPIVARAIATSRRLEVSADVGIEALAADWTASQLAKFCADEDHKNFVHRFPILFPVHWMAFQKQGMPEGKFLTVFEQSTGVTKAFKQPVVRWAVQVMNERIALRQLV